MTARPCEASNEGPPRTGKKSERKTKVVTEKEREEEGRTNKAQTHTHTPVYGGSTRGAGEEG